MERLSDNNNIFLEDGSFCSKDDLINLYRLQRVLLIEENILVNIIECINIWQNFSSSLQASWLFFPDKDEEILKYIYSSDYFTTFEDYCL